MEIEDGWLGWTDNEKQHFALLLWARFTNTKDRAFLLRSLKIKHQGVSYKPTSKRGDVRILGPAWRVRTVNAQECAVTSPQIPAVNVVCRHAFYLLPRELGDSSGGFKFEATAMFEGGRSRTGKFSVDSDFVFRRETGRLVRSRKWKIIFTMTGAFLVAAALYGLNVLLEPKIEKPQSKQPEKPLTLEQLFQNDFPDAMKATTPEPFVTFKWSEQDSLSIKANVYWDFVVTRTSFVAFFIASSPHTHEVSLALIDDVQRVLDFMKKVKINVRDPDQHQFLNEFPFSGRVFLYYKSEMTIKERAAVIDAYKAKNLDVQFRGPQYLQNMRIQQGKRSPPVK
jgi:hypothetical protein